MIRLLTIALLTCTPLLHADPTPAELQSLGLEEFQTGWQQWSDHHFARSAEFFRQAATHTPLDPSTHLWHATALFHQSLQLQRQNLPLQHAKTIDSLRSQAIASLETSIRLHPESPEAHAILASLYGMKINGSTLRAIRYGPSVQKHQQLALQYGPNNPRTHYLLGMALFHTAKQPADYLNALNSLTTAEKLFQTENSQPANPNQPRWGHSACLTFIGQTHEHLQQTQKAIAAYQKALELHPADHIAQNGLKRLTPTTTSP